MRFLFKKGQAVAMVTQQRRRGRWSRRRDDMRLLHPRALALALVVLALATPRPHLPLSPAAAQENGTGTTVSSDVMDDENDDGTFSSALECEIELEYSASAINMPKFDATFAIRNNRGSELSAWQVVWRYASEKLIPGSVEGAILLATGTSTGQPARVVNTRNNAPIEPFSTKGFTFEAYSTLEDDEREGVSRAPESISVNGLSCQPVSISEGNASRSSAQVEDCIPPEETNSSVLFLPTCLKAYCCGLFAKTESDNLQKKEARRNLLPAKVIMENENEDDTAWYDCSSKSKVVLVQNATASKQEEYVKGSDVIIAAMIEPGGYFGLCTNTSVGPLFGEDFFDFYLLTNENQAVSLSVILGVADGGEQTKLQELVETEVPLYSVTDLNSAKSWKHVILDLNELGVPGWAFFGLRNNEKNSAIPVFLYDMGLYSSVDKAVGQARPPKRLNWDFLQKNTNLSEITGLLVTEPFDHKDRSMIPVLICSITAVLVIMTVAIASNCIVRQRQLSKGRTSKRTGTTNRFFGNLDIKGLKDAIVRRYEKKSDVILDEAPADGIFDINFQSEIELKELIGSGGFGTVHKAIWKGDNVAVKIMHGMVEGSQTLETFKKEIFLLSRLQHPGIINFLGASLQPPDICIVQELAVGGSLYTLLHGSGSETKPLKYLDILQYGLDIADAMAYLHPTIVHRDLKSQNVLLDENKRAKVCDFGIAKFKDKTLLTTVNSQAGTPAYMAPELFSAGDASEKVDVFSYGVLLWECFTGCIPWGELNTPMQVIFAVGVQKQRLPVPPHCPTFLARLMADCWREDPEERPTFSKILNWIEAEYDKYVAQKSLQVANGDN